MRFPSSQTNFSPYIPLSAAVEGMPPKDGLAVIRDDGDDLMPALARPMVNGEETGDG